MIYLKKKKKLHVYNMTIYDTILLLFLMYSLWKVRINGYEISSSVEAWDEDACFQYLLTLSQIFQN